jgi:phosphoserine phosphatase
VLSHRVAAMMAFNQHRELIIRDGRLTREVAIPGAAAKCDALNDLRARFEIEAADTLARGDGVRSRNARRRRSRSCSPR